MKKIFQNTIDSLHLFFEMSSEWRRFTKKEPKKKPRLELSSAAWSLVGTLGYLFARLVDHWYPFLIAGLLGVVFSLFEGPHPRPKPAREAYAEYLARRQEQKRQRDSSRNPEK